MSVNTNTAIYQNACTIGAYLMEVILHDGITDETGAKNLMVSYTQICCKALGQNGPQMSIDIADRYKKLYWRNRQ